MARVTLVEKTQGLITAMISNREYDENNYLPNEGELCKKFGVSRVTVREAVRSLEVRGFLRREHGKGIVVVDNSVQVLTRFITDMLSMQYSDMLQLIEMRAVIEVEAARMAALRADNNDLKRLKKPLDVMEDAESMDDEYYAADLEFHIGLGKASKNNFLSTIIHAYTPLLMNVVVASSQQNYSLERKFHFHRNIYDCIANHDADGAMAEMRNHLNATEKHIMARQMEEGSGRQKKVSERLKAR